MCFCWIVIPKTRASVGAAAGALEVMMASIHHAAISNADTHQMFLVPEKLLQCDLSGVRYQNRRHLCRGKQGRLCSTCSNRTTAEPVLAGEADSTVRQTRTTSPSAEHVNDTVSVIDRCHGDRLMFGPHPGDASETMPDAGVDSRGGARGGGCLFRDLFFLLPPLFVNE